MENEKTELIFVFLSFRQSGLHTLVGQFCPEIFFALHDVQFY